MKPDRAANMSMMREVQRKRNRGIKNIRPVLSIKEDDIGDITLNYGTGDEITPGSSVVNRLINRMMVSDEKYLRVF